MPTADAYVHFASEADLSGHQLDMQQQLHILCAETRGEQVVQLLEKLRADYSEGLTELKKLKPDVVYKAGLYSFCMCLLQVSTLIMLMPGRCYSSE